MNQHIFNSPLSGNSLPFSSFSLTGPFCMKALGLNSFQNKIMQNIKTEHMNLHCSNMQVHHLVLI